MNHVTSIILGGGRGTRLYPLTIERAKPAVTFAGKYRLIDIPLSNCINSGVKRIFVLTQFMSASLHRHIMQTYQFDTFTDGFVDILAAEQTPYGSEWFQGTADAVRATLNHTTYYKADQTLILSGDHLYRMDYSRLIDFHRENKADITICVHPVCRLEAPEMGLLRVDGDGIVKEFVEKPKDPNVLKNFITPSDTNLFSSIARGTDQEESYLASMGVYVFEPDILREALSDRSLTDFGKEIIPVSIDRYKIAAYPFNEYWRDIGTIRSFFETNIGLAQPKPVFPLYQPGWPIYTRTRSLPPSRVIQSNIKDSLIVEGSDITGASISDSIIGLRSIIRKGSVLNDVVMHGSDYYEGEENEDYLERVRGNRLPRLGIGENCRIERAIIDKNVYIGKNVAIITKPGTREHNGDLCWVRDGITIIPKGTFIPDGTVL